MYLSGRVASQMDEGDYTRGEETLLKVWGRKWVDCSWMEEFRLFYHEYQPTALTQYDQRCYFP
jgi:hypothetical protein